MLVMHLALSTYSMGVRKMEFQQAVDESLQELGYQQIKPKQYEAIQAFVAYKKDVFVALLTGYGKSVINGILPTNYEVYYFNT